MKKTTIASWLMVALILVLFGINNSSFAQAGTVWTSRLSASDNAWRSVVYGNGVFVAVASSGTGTRVMTSTDGKNWTTRSSAADIYWYSVTYGNNLFVAVGYNVVMTSPDGITWTLRASAANNQWTSVTYGNNKFVAVANSGTYRVMTSTNGINWSAYTAGIETNSWTSVTYGNNLFVAVANSGTANRVMTSTDGYSWMTRNTTGLDNPWTSVSYGSGKFVAVASGGTVNRAMSSSDGIIWTLGTSIENNGWSSVTYGNGLFVAVSNSTVPANHSVMTSIDGNLWTPQNAPIDKQWSSVTYGNGLFVAVANNGTVAGNRVMTSGCLPITSTDVHTACSSYTWINNKTYTSSNTTATDTLTNAENCDSIVTLNLTILMDITTTTSGGTTFSNQSGATYKWLDCNNSNSIIPSQTGQSFTPTANGSYAVEVTMGLCVDTSACVNYNSIGIKEYNGKKEFSVYPNPAHNVFTVESIITDGTIMLMDINGKMMLQQKINATKTSINASKLNNGVYLLQLVDSSNMIFNETRIVINK